MQIRFTHSPEETKQMSTMQLREHFLVQQLMQEDSIRLVYSHYDRMIIGGVNPVRQSIQLPNPSELRAAYFLERREMGVINVGGKGTMTIDNSTYELNKLDCVYAGKGVRSIAFASADENDPAVFYFLSAPAHAVHPTMLCTRGQALPAALGAAETANQRTVYKYIHAAGIKSCQLVMGLTVLESGSVWNTMPAHTHTRRMEVYFYFDVQPQQRVMHFMGEPQETRHLIVANHEAIVSPPWSIHSGCGTSNYGFIWGMAGENIDYADMDPAPVESLF